MDHAPLLKVVRLTEALAFRKEEARLRTDGLAFTLLLPSARKALTFCKKGARFLQKGARIPATKPHLFRDIDPPDDTRTIFVTPTPQRNPEPRDHFFVTSTRRTPTFS